MKDYGASLPSGVVKLTYLRVTRLRFDIFVLAQIMLAHTFRSGLRDTFHPGPLLFGKRKRLN